MPLEKLLPDRSKSNSKTKVKYGTGKKKHLKSKTKQAKVTRKVPFSPSNVLPPTLLLVCFGSSWRDVCIVWFYHYIPFVYIYILILNDIDTGSSCLVSAALWGCQVEFNSGCNFFVVVGHRSRS